VKPRLLQTGLFIPLAPEPEKLELTLARLAKLVGPDNLGSPELLDTHRPDAFRVRRFELKETKRKRSKQQTAISNQQLEIGNRKCLLGFRRFRPPLRALVRAERGQPTEISTWDKNKSVYGKVVCLAGPWRTSGDWWRLNTWARDEWDVAVENGSGINGGHSGPRQQMLYRIYRELRSKEWFVEGVYD
jgi:protein ImuB